MNPFKAFRVHADKSGVSGGVEQLTLEDLTPGEVIVKGEWSSINYKDALAATGAGRILRTSPLVGGVDIAGTVISSSDKRIAVGQRVLMNGGGLSEVRDGGFTEVASLPGEGVIPIPDALSTRDAMLIGTAGFTAAYAIHRMQQNDQRPDNGPVAVTGATGGVGSVAIDMLAGLGYEVVAMNTKPDQSEYLQALGARQVLALADIDFGQRPLEKGTWAGAIDNLGGATLAELRDCLAGAEIEVSGGLSPRVAPMAGIPDLGGLFRWETDCAPVVCTTPMTKRSLPNSKCWAI